MAHVPFSSVEAIAAGVEHMQESYTLSCHQEPITSLCVSGVSLFSAGRDRLLVLYDLSPALERGTPQMLASFTLKRAAHSIAADRSRVYCATGSADIDVVEWSEEEGMIIGDDVPSLEGHTRSVTALAVHDGLLYSSANDNTVRLWDGVQLLMTLAEGVDPYGSLSVMGDRIGSCADAGGCCVSLWQFSLMQVKAREAFAMPSFLRDLLGRKAEAVKHAGGRAAAAAGAGSGGGSSESLTSSLDCLHTWVEPDSAVHTVLLFGDGGSGLLSASSTGVVGVWDLTRLRPHCAWGHGHFGHALPVSALALCGSLVCTASRDLTVRVARCVPKERREVESEEAVRADKELVDDMDAPLLSKEGEEALPEHLRFGEYDFAAAAGAAGAAGAEGGGKARGGRR